MAENNMTLITTVLPIALGIIMLGLGLSLTLEDFRRVLRGPKAVLLALITQMVVLPVVAVLLSLFFSLPPDLAIGMMILAASPGGATANLFSHLAHGDVALNLTLTAVNSLLSIVTLPLIVNFSVSFFSDRDQTLGMMFQKFAEVFAIVVLPVAVGMFIRSRRKSLADSLDKTVRIFSFAFLLAIIVGALIKDWKTVAEFLPQVGGAVLAFNLLSLGFGYGLPKLFRIEDRQATAIAMEVGIHNGALAMFVAIAILGSVTMATPAAIYSLLMLLTAGIAAWLLRARRAIEK